MKRLRRAFGRWFGRGLIGRGAMHSRRCAMEALAFRNNKI
jgi:hypothetical protein